MKPDDANVPQQSPEKLCSTLLHVAFAGCIIGLAILALLPAEAMRRSSLGGHAEHFIAYLGTTIVMGLAFRQRPRLVLRCALLVGYAAILETGQLYSPGRHAAFQDFAFSSSGIIVAGLLLWLVLPRLSTWLGTNRTRGLMDSQAERTR
jgi:VanZ family protein